MSFDPSQDHSRLRAMIYALARVKLREDLYRSFEELDRSMAHEQLRALKSSIEQFEADFTDDTDPPSLQSKPQVTDAGDDAPTTGISILRRAVPARLVVASQYDAPIPDSFFASAALRRKNAVPLPTIYEDRTPSAIRRVGKRINAAVWSTIQLVVAAALGAAIYTALATHMVSFGWSGARAVDKVVNENSSENTVPKQATSNLHSNKNSPFPAETAYRPGVRNIPIPADYGAYAVVDGHLTDLDLLPIRVPDARVAISAPISMPSRVHLPIGQLQFLIFRRDLANNAPDRAVVRVVARVVRALTFSSSGKPAVNNVDGPWVIRSNSYEMKVAPIADSPEMILIRPEHPEFVFPAGRYALVLKDIAYDFTLDGPMFNSAHCLERTDALNAPVYTECRKL